MKFLMVLCLLAVAAADDEKTQEKKTQSIDSTQSQGLTQPTGSLLGGQVFPSTGFPISNFGYTGFNPIQTVNPDFFNTAQATPGAISTFPRTVIPGTSAVGYQSGFPVQGGAFPVQGGVFPGVVSGYAPHFQGVGPNLLSGVSGVPTVSHGALDANTAATHGALSSVPYRFLTSDSLSGLGAQGLQSAQSVGLSGIPAFTSGILPAISNGIFQGQTFPAGVLKNPTAGATSGISSVPGLTTGNTSSGPLTSVFRTN